MLCVGLHSVPAGQLTQSAGANCWHGWAAQHSALHSRHDCEMQHDRAEHSIGKPARCNGSLQQMMTMHANVLLCTSGGGLVPCCTHVLLGGRTEGRNGPRQQLGQLGALLLLSVVVPLQVLRKGLVSEHERPCKLPRSRQLLVMAGKGNVWAERLCCTRSRHSTGAASLANGSIVRSRCTPAAGAPERCWPAPAQQPSLCVRQLAWRLSCAAHAACQP